LFGMRVWPGILVGALVANYLTPIAGLTAEVIALGNTGEAVVAAALLQYFGFDRLLERASDVFKFVLAVLISTIISATIGNLALCFAGSAPWDQFPQLWLTWWLGDVSGAVIVTPLLLAWGVGLRPWSKSRAIEGVLLVGLLSVAAMVTFSGSS